jgi:type IV fimbrial biogenesis protein FimT
MRRTRPPQGGFTLIEILVTVALLVLLVGLAAPSFQSAILTSRLSSYANSFLASAQFARTEAFKRNAAITLCASADGATSAAAGTFAQGWIVMCKVATALPNVCNSAGPDNLVLQKSPALDGTFRFTTTGDVYTLVFPASGVGATQIVGKLCRAIPEPGSQERQINISVSGRTTITTTHTGTCAA